MPPAEKRRKFSPAIAQASADASLANSRVEVLQQAGYKVRTFTSADKLAIACKNENFDLLLVGHSLEGVEREQICAAFRTHNPDAPIIQLQVATTTPTLKIAKTTCTTADYAFDVEQGPEALLQLLDEILDGWNRDRKFGD